MDKERKVWKKVGLGGIKKQGIEMRKKEKLIYQLLKN